MSPVINRGHPPHKKYDDITKCYIILLVKGEPLLSVFCPFFWPLTQCDALDTQQEPLLHAL